MVMVRTLAAILLISSIFLIAGAHLAQAAVPAGFAPGPVWLSQSAPLSGSLVRIYTVVHDGSSTALEGSVTFKIDGAAIGSSPFSLEPGESAIKSYSWTATEGTHQVSAEITSATDKRTKETTIIERSTTTILSVAVGPEAPKPAALEAVDTAQSVVASSTPVVAGIVAGATATTESIRKAGESYLASLAGEAATASSKPKNSVLGAETEAPKEEAFTPIEESWTQKVAKAVLPLFRYPALFYPVFLSLILFAFWLVIKHLRNPKKRR